MLRARILVAMGATLRTIGTMRLLALACAGCSQADAGPGGDEESSDASAGDAPEDTMPAERDAPDAIQQRA